MFCPIMFPFLLIRWGRVYWCHKIGTYYQLETITLLLQNILDCVLLLLASMQCYHMPFCKPLWCSFKKCRMLQTFCCHGNLCMQPKYILFDYTKLLLRKYYSYIRLLCSVWHAVPCKACSHVWLSCSKPCPLEIS